MTVRERFEREEHARLSPLAAFSDAARRDSASAPCPYRTEYQRDRDRILHCKAFRRLKHKTQVFLSPEGDHYRTRLTHTLEVAQIARTVARALRLNEDLTEAIALGHDLGHTPFGHAGERALDRLMEGGFRHYEQSVRVVERLENDGVGLNLTVETRDGIVTHTGGRQADTLEGRIVRLADKVAYISHDIDDAVRAGVLRESDVPPHLLAAFGEGRAARIDRMVTAIVENSAETVCMDAPTAALFEEMHAFMYASVYTNPVAKSEESKVNDFIEQMFTHFVKHPETLPSEYTAIYEQEGAARAVCDYIAGMTDNYALDVYRALFIPRSWGVKIVE